MKVGGAVGITCRIQPQSSIIFCNTKQTCNQLADWLQDHKVSALALHGDLEQNNAIKSWFVLPIAACRFWLRLMWLRVVWISNNWMRLSTLIWRATVKCMFIVSAEPVVQVNLLALNLISPQDLAALNRLENFAKMQIDLKSLPTKIPCWSTTCDGHYRES